MRSRLTVAVATAALLVSAGPGAAQDWQDMSVSRAVDGERSVVATVRYGAGQFRVAPGEPGSLYRMNLTWDDEKFEPVVDYDDGRLDLGIETRRRSLDMKGRNRSEMELWLGPDVAMDLRLEFGAVEADLDLGGLSLSSLEVATGASEARLDVSRPNPIEMSRAVFDVGAADFEARGLANFGAREFEVNAGVGSVMLDLSGQLVRDLDVEITMGVGSLELRIPEGVGVRIEKQSFFASFDADEMVERAGAWYSSGWDDAEHRIRIDVDTAFGSIDVVWMR